MRSPALVAALLGLAACGGEEDGGPPPKPASPAAPSATAKPAAKPGAKAGDATLSVYRKVEDVVTEGEQPSIRHDFRERDFTPDPTGTENRDPFRSYVILQPGVGVTDNTGIPVEATEVCPVNKQLARGYGVRELKLSGIVSRGTTRYALFSDTKQEGHIVHRGDCLGKEKARVKEIGAGFVTLELVAEPVPNQPPRPPEERSIPLYPKELPVGEDAGDEEGEPGRGPRPSTPSDLAPSTPPRATAPPARGASQPQ